MHKQGNEPRIDANGNVLCEFCDEKAIYKNCKFWTSTQEESMCGPFDVCENHFEQYSFTHGHIGFEASK